MYLPVWLSHLQQQHCILLRDIITTVYCLLAFSLSCNWDFTGGVGESVGPVFRLSLWLKSFFLYIEIR